MKRLRWLIAGLFLFSMPGLSGFGCGGADLENPNVFVDDEDSPEEREMLEEMEAELEELIQQEDRDN